MLGFKKFSTAEYQAQHAGDMTIDLEKTITKSDLDTRLIDGLGNPSDITKIMF